MARISPILLAAVPLMFGASLSLFAEDCSPAPTAPARNPDEANVAAAYQKALVDSAGCAKGNEGVPCSVVVNELKELQLEVHAAAVHSEACASNGTLSGGAGALAVSDIAWYKTRTLFWNAFYNEMTNNTASVANGTYKISAALQSQFLSPAVVPTPAAPSIPAKLSEGTSQIQGNAQPTNPQFPTASTIYLCVWASKPAGSLDCKSGNGTTKPAKLSTPSGTDKAGYTFVPANPAGAFSAQLSTPLSNGQYVSAVEVTAPATGDPLTTPSAAATGVGLATNCYSESSDPRYNDCDLKLSVIGGIEQSAQSSSQSATTGFLRVFTRASPGNSSNFYVWAYVRLLGAPTTSSTNGVVSVVSNPSGGITTQTFSSIGTSIDYMVGVEYEFPNAGRAYSASLIAGYGGTTPFQANTLSLAYTAPTYGTVECPTLYKRFQNQFSADNIVLGTPSNAVTPSCLVNANSPTAANAGTFTPINTIGFSNQDRTSFLGKEFVGIRTIDRFMGSGNLACGDNDPVNHIGPCERGIVDFTFGQDASITGGQMRHFIFKIDAVHPLPVASVKVLYLFGSMSVRLERNTNNSPLILQSANVSTLTGTGSGAIPNPSTVVLSLVQPDRDFYRFGVGVNINQIFTKLFSTATPNSSTP